MSTDSTVIPKPADWTLIGQPGYCRRCGGPQRIAALSVHLNIWTPKGIIVGGTRASSESEAVERLLRENAEATGYMPRRVRKYSIVMLYPICEKCGGRMAFPWEAAYP